MTVTWQSHISGVYPHKRTRLCPHLVGVDICCSLRDHMHPTHSWRLYRHTNNRIYLTLVSSEGHPFRQWKWPDKLSIIQALLSLPPRFFSQSVNSLFTLSAQPLYSWTPTLSQSHQKPLTVQLLAALYVAVTCNISAHATSFLCQPWCGAEPNLSDTLHSINIHSRCCHSNTNGMLINTHTHGQFQCISLQL